MDVLKTYTNIFWDFDGVIKNSLEVKANAFYKLFLKFGIHYAKEIKKHHNENLGVSRFDKIPLYLERVGIKATKKNIKIYEKEFSKLTTNGVINSRWNSKVHRYILKNYNYQNFYLVSATPPKDIKFICTNLKIDSCFIEIHGSYATKSQIIHNIIKSNKLKREKSLMVGDTKNDLIAAQENNISFVLSTTKFNKDLQHQCILI